MNANCLCQKVNLFFLLVLLLIFSFIACNDDDSDPPVTIEGITIENYPRMDGSTSTAPLNNLLVANLLNLKYSWERSFDDTWFVHFDFSSLPEDFKTNRVKVSKTHDSFINLIDDKTDIILTARTMSEDEKKYAKEKQITLLETPIALDAFIFLTNPENPVKDLTTKQIQDIYMGKIRNWKEVGGKDLEIEPFVRNENSGSQELMESLVMKNVEMPLWRDEWTAEHGINSMLPVFHILRGTPGGICYTVYYYKEMLVRDKVLKSPAVNGVQANKKTIANRSYPYTSEVYVVIRSNTEKQSMTYKLYDLLVSGKADRVIEESGYVPL